MRLPALLPKRVLVFLACLALALVLVILVYVLRRAPSPPLPETGVLLGLWQPGAPANMRQVAEFESQAGKKSGIIQFYYKWEQRLDPALVENVIGYGALPLITWEPESGCHAINDGEFDHDIERWASDLARFKDRTPVLFRPMHEMNIHGYPWSIPDGGCTEVEYIEAWRRIHRIFDQTGAGNVQLIWCPNVFWNEETEFEGVFPGDAYVDWICLDGYNWGADNWLSFGEVFRESYDRITALSAKPLLIAEMASAEAGDSGARKAAWIMDALENEIPKMPRLKAIIWFNEVWNGAAFPVSSTEAARQAFSQSVASTLYVSDWRRWDAADGSWSLTLPE